MKQQKPKETSSNDRSYVQDVPDHCDRITWRGSYYHLPLTSAPTISASDVGAQRYILKVGHSDDAGLGGEGWVVRMSDHFSSCDSSQKWVKAEDYERLRQRFELACAQLTAAQSRLAESSDETNCDGATPVRASTAEVVLPLSAEPTASPVHPDDETCTTCEGTGWDNVRQQPCDCTESPSKVEEELPVCAEPRCFKLKGHDGPHEVLPDEPEPPQKKCCKRYSRVMKSCPIHGSAVTAEPDSPK